VLASVQSAANEAVIEHPSLHFWLHTLSAFARSDTVALGIMTGMWYIEWVGMKKWRRTTEYRIVWVVHAMIDSVGGKYGLRRENVLVDIIFIVLCFYQISRAVVAVLWFKSHGEWIKKNR
jgi:uncharacterized membrane protein